MLLVEDGVKLKETVASPTLTMSITGKLGSATELMTALTELHAGEELLEILTLPTKDLWVKSRAIP